jgi:hypothetical protein
MRLKITLNDGDGYDTTHEFIADAQTGMIHDPDDSPLKASERIDLGQITAAFSQEGMDDAGLAIEQLEALESEIQTALDGRPKKAEIELWRQRIESIVVRLKDSIGKIDGEGRHVGAILEVVQ